MKILLFLLLPLGAIGQVNNASPQNDTVKCWMMVIDPKDTTHLVLTKAWVIREYTIVGYKSIDSVKIPMYIKTGRPIKYLAPNKRDSLAVLDFKPIIQEWK